VTKFILIVCALLLVYALVKGVRRRNRRMHDAAKSTAQAHTDEDMVRCAQCGVHLPRSESLVTQGQYYCCAEHRRRHQPAP